MSDPERRALDQALSHAGTPIRRQLDPLGRAVATVEVIEAGVELTETFVLDFRGLSTATIDRRGLAFSTRAFDRAGRQILEDSADAGERRSLFDALGREILHWREHTEHRRTFDLAGRVTELRITDGASNWLAERTTYGEGQPGAIDRNQLGRVVRVEDAAGRAETLRYGAFGEPLETERTLTLTPGLDPDWSGAVPLEASAHRSISAFDALGRRARAWLPDGTFREEDYLRSGPMQSLRVTNSVTRTVLADADYGARGQELSITLGNGVEITNTYDAQTFRLYRRHAVDSGGSTYQDLRHHYDPVGNLIYLADLAQSPTATHVINGLTVDAHRAYSHDARYQLIEATGRVHRALTDPDFRGDVPTTGAFRGTRRLALNDGTKVARYRRTYTYDDAGNLSRWTHGPEGAGPGNSWTHDLWVSPTSNRSYPAKDLNGINIPNPEARFNARGHIVELPSVRAMDWSARDQLRRTLLIERATDPDDEELYDYAADETRLRKTTRRLVSGTVERTETLYLDGCELRRITQGSTVILERWSAHAEAEERLATIYFWDSDTLARETPDPAAVKTHFHLGTRQGSVSLELDASAQLLSYEEHFPYGRTAFVAGTAVTEVAFRTRRFVGKDQDDATGFYVFQYRYYAPFIGNWVSPDPAGEVDGPNRYAYARNNPTTLVDLDGLQVGPSGTQDQPGVGEWLDFEDHVVVGRRPQTASPSDAGPDTGSSNGLADSQGAAGDAPSSPESSQPFPPPPDFAVDPGPSPQGEDPSLPASPPLHVLNSDEAVADSLPPPRAAGEAEAPRARPRPQRATAAEVPAWFWNQPPAVSARDILRGDPEIDRPPAAPSTVTIGILGADGDVTLREFRVADDA
ncbi:MAG TPA: hypothetical protein ENK57_19435, partial [Polyangiaceae bacterium]|nr:hypothetical protein [Polyangiaceae bacterium]